MKTYPIKESDSARAKNIFKISEALNGKNRNTFFEMSFLDIGVAAQIALNPQQPRLQLAEEFLKIHLQYGLQKVKTKFLTEYGKDELRKAEVVDAFGIFLYKLARTFDPNDTYTVDTMLGTCSGSLKSKIEIDDGAYLTLAKVLGLHKLTRYIANVVFFEIEAGKQFLENSEDYAKKIMPTYKELESFLRLLPDDLDSAFYQLRIKSPYDVYEKLKRNNLSGNPLQLHDILAGRLILKDKEMQNEKDRIILIDLVKGVLLDQLTKQGYTPNFNNGPSEAIKDYHLKPKPNGYNRLHLLYLKNDIPIELQIDTESNYYKLENSLDSIHGIQKDPEHIKKTVVALNERKVKLIIEVYVNKGTRKERTAYERYNIAPRPTYVKELIDAVAGAAVVSKTPLDKLLENCNAKSILIRILKRNNSTRIEKFSILS